MDGTFVEMIEPESDTLFFIPNQYEKNKSVFTQRTEY